MAGRAAGRSGDAEAARPERAWATWAALAAILLLGLVLRASYLREIVDDPDFSLPQVDACYNDYWARGIATGDWTLPKNLSNWIDPEIRSNPYLRPPAYPFFLAVVYSVSNGSYLAPRIAQMVLGLVNCILAYFLGRRVFGHKPGLIFALLMSSYWVFIYFEGELLAPVLLVTLGQLLLYVLSLWSDRFTWWRGFAGGIVLGLFALVRSNVLLFAPVVLGWSWWIARRRRDGRRLAPMAAGLVIGTAMMIAPVTIRNWIVAKDFVLITANVGISLYTGNHEGATGRHATIPDLAELGANEDWTCFDYPKIARGVAALTGKETKYSDVSSYFVGKSLDFMRRHPGEALKLVAIKAALFWGPDEVPSNKAIDLGKANSVTLRHLPGFPLPLSLAIFGLIQLLWTRRVCSREDRVVSPSSERQFELVVLIVLFILIYSLSFLPFFVVGRYRVPVVPPLLLLGSYGLYRLGCLFFDAKCRGTVAWRAIRTPAVWLAILAGLYVLASIPIVPCEPDPARWHLMRASCYRLADKPQLALAECQEAIRIRPDSVKGHRRLADLLYRKGDYSGAAEHYSTAVELRPDYLEARYNLAMTLFELKRFDEAIDQLRWVVKHHPNQVHVHYSLANAFKAKGEVDEAIRHYRRALQLKPDYYQAHNNLANALMAQGKADEAISHYRQALQINPDYVTAQRNMNRALRSQGKQD